MSTRQVAIIVNVNKPYDRKVVAGVARYVRLKSDWQLYLEDEPLAKIPDLRRWHGHGIIADLDDEQVATAVAGLEIPVIGIGGAISDEARHVGLFYVFTDNDAIGRLAAEHLLERGLRSFAYCGMPRSPYNPWSRRRGESFTASVQRAGFACSTYFGRHLTARRWEVMQDGLCNWIARLKTPLGLLACNDARARHVLESCRRLGLRIPEDVAILGVDNDEMMCELTTPALSSVVQGTDLIGFEAARLLDRLMSGRRVSNTKRWLTIEPTGIVTRASTDILAAADGEVARALDFIRDHIGDGLQVCNVTDHVDLSRSTLDNRFKAQLGRTVHDEIERVRLNRTKHLLLNTDLSLAEISRQTGFGTVQYMASVFRRSTGQTARHYRHSKRIGR